MKNNNESVDSVVAYLAFIKQRGDSPRSIRTRYDQFTNFRNFLDANGIVSFQNVTEAHLNGYRQMLMAEGLKISTICSRLGAVRQLFSWLEERVLIFENPARTLTLPRIPKSLPAVIDPFAVKRLLGAVDCSDRAGIRDRAMLELLYATGVRQLELMTLKVVDLDLPRETIRVTGKGRKDRMVPMGRQAARALKEYLRTARPQFMQLSRNPEDPALWLGRRSGRPLNPGSKWVCKIVQKYAKIAGITQPVTTHTLRRSCATHMLQNGAHPVIVAELLGHSDLKTLSHYLRLTITDIRKMHEKSKPGR